MFRKIVIALFIGLVLASCAWGAVDLYVTPTTATFERNSGNGRYNVTVKVQPDAPVGINALGDFYLVYDLNVFEEITVANFTDHAASIGWDASLVSFNAGQSGSLRTIRYGKTKTTGAWNASAGAHDVFTLSMFVKKDAVTGNTFVYFDRTKNNIIIDAVIRSNIIGEIEGATYNITLDNTTPNSSISVPPGIYMNPQNVQITTDEHLHEALIHYSTSNWITSVTTADPTPFINIPGFDNQVWTTTLKYYAEDFALDKDANFESPTKEATYVIDRVTPSITVTTYNSAVLSDGQAFWVEFTTSELVRATPIVTVGGLGMSNDPGNTYPGTGPFIFTRTLSGLENTNGQVIITVHDLAQPGGNQGVTDSINASFDFGGPSFNVYITPNPVRVEEELIITFDVSEQLSTTPDVDVGLISAYWVSENLIVPEYEFRVTVSGYGWLIDFGPDDEKPYTYDHIPTFNETGVDPEASITFKIADRGSGVASSSIYIMIDGKVAVDGGAVTNKFSGSVISDGIGGYIVSLKPEDGMNPNQEVEVVVEACDLSPSQNALDPLVFSFWTSSGGDLRLADKPLAIPTVFDPRVESTEIVYKLSQDNDIEIRVYDIGGNFIWQQICAAGTEGGREGLNMVSWDGFNGYQVMESNGVYMFYVIEYSNKAEANVLGQGKLVIFKE